MVSEIDIRDWEQGPVTKLYNVPRKTYIEEVWSGKIFFFDHIDGMYSVCTDFDGTIFHLSAYSDVIPLKEKK